MKTILISFQPKWQEQIRSGNKIYEYRTQFPKEPVAAYMYVSKPVQAITGYVLFSERIPLVRWTDEYKDDPEVLLRIEECMKKRKYAARILSYIDTVPIELASIREAITDFIIPQSYYFLDNFPELFSFIKENAVLGTYRICNDFSCIDKNQICFFRR